MVSTGNNIHYSNTNSCECSSSLFEIYRWRRSSTRTRVLALTHTMSYPRTGREFLCGWRGIRAHLSAHSRLDWAV
ncbi:hypothetical protein BX600DRAFT_454317 [Xylariales sp. PMI_506]|nr:hypothetical protein BX600DRAFT_454317 [Xylariales sp. PMI_506]